LEEEDDSESDLLVGFFFFLVVEEGEEVEFTEVFFAFALVVVTNALLLFSLLLDFFVVSLSFNREGVNEPEETSVLAVPSLLLEDFFFRSSLEEGEDRELEDKRYMVELK